MSDHRNPIFVLEIFVSLGIMLFFMVSSCTTSETSQEDTVSEDGFPNLFSAVASSTSGITFINRLEETLSSNYYQYMYTYIGGGVASADFNNDGWIDLFFISNTFDNKLYLNQGDHQEGMRGFSFMDVTEQSGIQKRPGFDVGVSVVDINSDGYLDIYITRGGWIQDDNRFANMLYVNNGDMTFTERAAEYGLADSNRGICATFFDYDNDGDLDVYISNSPDFEDKAAEVVDLIDIQDDAMTLAKKGSDKLYENDGSGHFTDASEASGILPDIGFGLNPQVGDLNQDGWMDIYICNDFRIPDFVYINNQDGTFRDGRNEVLRHMSFNSMGSDIGDVNNDGLMDVFTLDMNPEDYVRAKTTMAMTPVERFEEMVAKNYHHQYMHNMLQINNGNGTFREIANMAGVANTDWSWSSLLADFDLDGYNDLFVTNGVFRDVIDRDANNEILQILRDNQRKPTDEDFLAFTRMLPQQKLNNYFFKNNGDLTFADVSTAWIDSMPTFSNGAVYADLDNDGDLDVVVSNINEEATLLRNHAVEKSLGSYLQVTLDGPLNNTKGIGSTVRIELADGSVLTRQQINNRGFLSSVSNTMHFGLARDDVITSLEIRWPDGRCQEIKDVPVGHFMTLSYDDAVVPKSRVEDPEAPLFVKMNWAAKHIDPSYNDYQNQLLLPHKLSQIGPAVAVTDVNMDGHEDLFIGGGHTQAGQLFLGDVAGGFTHQEVADFIRDKQSEDVGACFVDADGDGDPDLYVVSGSYEFPLHSRLQLDRLYLNDGRGHFSKSLNSLPPIGSAGKVVKAADFDQDGDMDLFVGGRVVPAQYPVPPTSYLLLNESGRFRAVTDELAPQLAQIGMVTDACWSDIDMDEDLDLVLTGEWMGIEVLVNEDGRLRRDSLYSGLASHAGWWNTLLVEDIDLDGDMDIAAGNLGLNYKLHATPEKPLHVYTNDFDYNGSVDVFLAKYYQGDQVPVRGKSCSTQQLPHLAKKIPTYEEFASLDLGGILGPGIKSALHYTVTELRSGIFINEGSGKFTFRPFDNHVQQSLINSILYDDFDNDGIQDLLMAGNNHMSEIETTRADAGIGCFLRGTETGKFEFISHLESGFFTSGDIRHLATVSDQTRHAIIVIKNNDTHELFHVNSRDLNQ